MYTIEKKKPKGSDQKQQNNCQKNDKQMIKENLKIRSQKLKRKINPPIIQETKEIVEKITCYDCTNESRIICNNSLKMKSMRLN